MCLCLCLYTCVFLRLLHMSSHALFQWFVVGQCLRGRVDGVCLVLGGPEPSSVVTLSPKQVFTPRLFPPFSAHHASLAVSELSVRACGNSLGLWEWQRGLLGREVSCWWPHTVSLQCRGPPPQRQMGISRHPCLAGPCLCPRCTPVRGIRGIVGCGLDLRPPLVSCASTLSPVPGPSASLVTDPSRCVTGAVWLMLSHVVVVVS